MHSVPVFPKRGERHHGVLTSQLPLLQGWSWPYTSILGHEDGPRVTITAGLHGCEYVSIRSAIQLASELDPANVRGSVLILPVVNLPAYWEWTPFLCPFDNKNPNRVFPGMANGTFSDALAHFIFSTVITPSDAFIDLHGGDLVEELFPFSLFPTGGSSEVVAQSRTMAEAFGLPYMVAHDADGLAYGSAAECGIPSVIAEAGSCGRTTPEEIELIVQGARRAMQVAGNLQGDPEPVASTLLERFEAVTASHAGFWSGDLCAGDEVKAGDMLGQVINLNGDLVESIEAPIDGVILARITSPAVKQGGRVVTLGA